MKRGWRAIVAALSITVFAAPARAQGLGVRAGASADPDQFYAGVHFETSQLAERLRFRPNVEAGGGEDLTLVALHFQFTYRFLPAPPRLPPSPSVGDPYGVGGPP